jgi:hypothetical protein
MLILNSQTLTLTYLGILFIYNNIVCASVGYHASSLRSLGHVVVLLLVTTEVPYIAGNEDVRGKT